MYSSLQFVVYHAPLQATDFVAPNIWQIQASAGALSVNFNVLVTDDGGTVQRVVVLYRALTSNTWSKVELAYNPGTGTASGTASGVNGPVEYFVQAVDGTGNVALAMDHGNSFQALAVNAKLYLPLIEH